MLILSLNWQRLSETFLQFDRIRLAHQPLVQDKLNVSLYGTENTAQSCATEAQCFCAQYSYFLVLFFISKPEKHLVWETSNNFGFETDF